LDSKKSSPYKGGEKKKKLYGGAVKKREIRGGGGRGVVGLLSEKIKPGNVTSQVKKGGGDGEVKRERQESSFGRSVGRG